LVIRFKLGAVHRILPPSQVVPLERRQSSSVVQCMYEKDFSFRN